jgi:hypothetical protein
MSDPNTAVVRQFLEALEKKDLSLVKARVDLTFDNPISPQGQRHRSVPKLSFGVSPLH